MRELAGEMNEGRSVDGVAVDLAPRGACTGRGMFASWKKTTSDGSSVQGSCCGWLEVEVEVEVEKGIWWGDAGDHGKGETGGYGRGHVGRARGAACARPCACVVPLSQAHTSRRRRSVQAV
jgi:hypothetical protein